MTKFSEIFESAVWRVRDFDSLFVPTENLEKQYSSFLKSAIADIEGFTQTELTYKEVDEKLVFVNTLTSAEINLLALGLVVKWLGPHFLNSDALKKGMYNKDYKEYGIGADKIATIYHELRREFEGKAKTMSFRVGDMTSWRAGSWR